MNYGDVAAWAAVVLFPTTFAVGWMLRRFASGARLQRLRPHFVLGYAVLVLAAIHFMLAMGAMKMISANDAWLATFAFGGLGLQTYLGVSLQSREARRIVIRRRHVVTACAVAALIAGHIALTL